METGRQGRISWVVYHEAVEKQFPSLGLDASNMILFFWGMGWFRPSNLPGTGKQEIRKSGKGENRSTGKQENKNNLEAPQLGSAAIVELAVVEYACHALHCNSVEPARRTTRGRFAPMREVLTQFPDHEES